MVVGTENVRPPPSGRENGAIVVVDPRRGRVDDVEPGAVDDVGPGTARCELGEHAAAPARRANVNPAARRQTTGQTTGRT